MNSSALAIIVPASTEEEIQADQVLPAISGGFVRCPNILFDHWASRLKPAQFILLCLLVRQTLGFNRATVSLSGRRFALLCNMSRSTWRRSRDELRALGLLGYEHSHGEYGDAPCHYWIKWATLLHPQRHALHLVETAPPTSKEAPWPTDGGGPDLTRGGGPDLTPHERQELSKNNNTDIAMRPVETTQAVEATGASTAAVDFVCEDDQEITPRDPANVLSREEGTGKTGSSDSPQETEAATAALARFGLRSAAPAILHRYRATDVLQRVEAFGERARVARNPAGFLRAALSWEMPAPRLTAHRSMETASASAATRAALETRRTQAMAQDAWRASVDAALNALGTEERVALQRAAEVRAQEQYGRKSAILVQVVLRELAAERHGLGEAPHASPTGRLYVVPSSKEARETVQGKTENGNLEAAHAAGTVPLAQRSPNG